MSSVAENTRRVITGTEGKVPLTVADTSEQYSLGNINEGQVALRTLGILGGKIGEATGAIMDVAEDVIIPQPVQWATNLVTDTLGTALLDSSVGQELTEFLAEHPEALTDAEAAVNALELWPAARGPKKALNGLLVQMKTKIKDFYTADPAKKAAGLVEAVDEAAGPTLATALSPQMTANVREKGTGVNRINEASQTGAKTRSDVRGNLAASPFMATQMGNKDTLSHHTPTYRAEVKGEYTANDTQGVVEALKSDYDVPDDIAKDLWNRSSNALSATGKKELISRAALDPLGRTSGKGNTTVIVRDKAAPESTLGGEATGRRGQTSRAVSRMQSKDGLKEFGKAYNIDPENMGTQDVVKFLNTAAPFERGPWLGNIKDSIPATYQASPGGAHSAYLKAKAKPEGKRNANQKKLVEVVDKHIANNKPNIEVDPETGYVKYRTSYTSEAKDLGGIGIAVTIDPKNKEVYSMLLDGHDLFGANPVGGGSLWNVTPIQKFGYGSNKGDVDIGRKTPAVAKREAEGVAELQRRTGMAPLDGETMMQYTQRVMQDYNAPVTLRDRATVAENVGMLGILGTNPQEEPTQ